MRPLLTLSCASLQSAQDYKISTLARGSRPRSPIQAAEILVKIRDAATTANAMPGVNRTGPLARLTSDRRVSGDRLARTFAGTSMPAWHAPSTPRNPFLDRFRLPPLDAAAEPEDDGRRRRPGLANRFPVGPVTANAEPAGSTGRLSTRRNWWSIRKIRRKR